MKKSLTALALIFTASLPVFAETYDWGGGDAKAPKIHYKVNINPPGKNLGTYSLVVDVISPLHGKSIAEQISIFRTETAENVIGNAIAGLKPFPMSRGRTFTVKKINGSTVTYDKDSWGSLFGAKVFKHHTQIICSDDLSPTRWEEHCHGNLNGDLKVFVKSLFQSSVCSAENDALKCRFTVDSEMQTVSSPFGDYTPTQAAYLFAQNTIHLYFVLARTAAEEGDNIENKAKIASDNYEDSDDFNHASKVILTKANKNSTSPVTIIDHN